MFTRERKRNMQKPLKECELLAPAGDAEALEAALFYGADAVYLGGPRLQLRAKRAGFGEEELIRAVTRIHEHNKKAYIAVNSYAYNEEIDAVPAYARFLKEAGADGVIVSDLGVIAQIRESEPELEVHVSTQANCQNWRSAQVYCSMGVKRIVLAREMNLDQIRQLRDRIPDDVTIEAFVHGAMCVAYSGRCILSSWLTGRSGNRGACAQPCRWNYVLSEETQPGEYFPVFEDGQGTEILSSHDIRMIAHLQELADAGVTSFKIEGRMKTAYYVATVVNAYRRAMDGTMDPELCLAETECVKHRPYETGFYYDHLREGHANDAVDTFDCTFAAKVLGREDGMLVIQQRSPFFVGDVLELIPRAGEGITKIPVTELINKDGEHQSGAPHPMQELRLPCNVPAEAGEFLRKRVCV